MSKHGFVLGIRPEKLDEYRSLHAQVWPEVLEILKNAHVSDYTIFQKDTFLFAVFEYGGTDLAADFEKMNAEPIIKKWYAECSPCQVPLETRAPGEWWAEMQTVFHMD